MDSPAGDEKRRAPEGCNTRARFSFVPFFCAYKNPPGADFHASPEGVRPRDAPNKRKGLAANAQK